MPTPRPEAEARLLDPKPDLLRPEARLFETRSPTPRPEARLSDPKPDFLRPEARLLVPTAEGRLLISLTPN